jgi:hypothetical protein
MKQYSFFFHYRKQTNGMTVHFRGKCYPCKYVNCQVSCTTKYNKTQPILTMNGKCSELIIEDDYITIV